MDLKECMAFYKQWQRWVLFISIYVGFIVISVTCLPLKAQISHLPHNIQEILRSTWPGVKNIRAQTYYLNDEQHSLLKKLARRHEPSRIHTFYIAQYDSNSINGQPSYGIFDSHIVRTKSETLFFVLDSQANMKKIQVVAFHEPIQYKAPVRWLKQVQQKLVLQTPGSSSSVNTNIDALSGATLTRQAIIDSTARIRLLYSTHIQKKH